MTFQDVPIERVQEFWDARPCNIRHSPLPVGTRAYFDEVEARKYRVEPHIPRFAEFEQWRGKRVLEVGCGIGTDTVNFAKRGAWVTAVDLSARSLELAQKRVKVYGLSDYVTFCQANAEQLTDVLPVEDYDLVYSFGVIHHTPNPSMALRQMAEYVGPGGTLKLMVYHRWSWKALGLLVRSGFQFWRWNEIIARQSEAQTGCPVTHTYTRRDVVRMLDRVGFKATGMSVEHIFPYRVADYVRYEYVKAWPFSWMPDGLFRWLEKRLGWHLCVTAERVAK